MRGAAEWAAPAPVAEGNAPPTFDWSPPAALEQGELSPPPDFDGELEDRSIAAELQRLGRSLAAPANEPGAALEMAPFPPVAAAMPGNWANAGFDFPPRLAAAVVAAPVASPVPLAKPSGKQRTAVLAWALMSVGLMALACGGVLLAWSLVAHRDELWSLGMPIALSGQFGLVLGLAWQTRLSVA